LSTAPLEGKALGISESPEELGTGVEFGTLGLDAELSGTFSIPFPEVEEKRPPFFLMDLRGEPFAV